MKRTTIYGSADVARLLSVTRSAVSNYLRRHDDTPEPAYVGTNGQDFWTDDGMAGWQAWQAKRGKKNMS